MNPSVPILEALAELEHRQWLHWSQAVAPYVPADIRARWEAAWCPYAELPDAARELDRIWARQVVELLRDRGVLLPT